MQIILFLIYIVIEAWIEMSFMKRLGSDASKTAEEKDLAYRNFAIVAAFWPVTILITLIAMCFYGGDQQ